MSKSIAKNAAFHVLDRTLTALFPLITSAYISRKLGASGVGEIASAQNLVTYFTMIASLGIPTYGTRAISQVKSSRKDLNRTFTELYLINSISTIFAFVAYLFLLWQLNGSIFLNSLQLIFSSMILLRLFNIEWLYQGFEEYKYITVRNCAIKFCSLILMLIFVRDEKSTIAYAIILCVGSAGNYFLNMFKLREYVSFDFSELNLRRHMAPIFTFFASVVAVEIYSLVDTTMLTYMKNSSVVGYYTNATKISKVTASMVTAIGAVMLPRLSVYFKERNYTLIEKTVGDFFNVIIMLAFPAAVGLAMTSTEMMYALFGMEFGPSIRTSQILSLLVIFMPISGGILGQILITSGRERYYLLGVTSGTLVNVIMNAVLIGRFDQNGAAMASVLTEFMIDAVMFIACKNVIKLRFSTKNLMSVIASCAFMALSLLLIKNALNGHAYFVRLITEVAVGFVIYSLGLVITRNRVFTAMIEKIKPKHT